VALPIDKINSRLEGEFTFGGRTYAVPFTLPGDRVQFKLGRKGGRLSMEVLHIERAEPQRETTVPAFCEFYGDCGGCRGQHLPYQRQLELKTAPVLSAMQSLGFTPDVIPAPSQRSYRNRMDFVIGRPMTAQNQSDSVQPTTLPRGTVGLRGARDFARFIDITSCAIQRDQGNTILEAVRRAAQSYPDASFDRTNATGVLKYATLRTGLSSCVVLTIETGRENDERYATFLAELKNLLPADCSIIEAATTSPSDVSCPPGGRVLRGKAGFTERLAGIDFEVAYDAFFQPNPQAFDQLISWCLETTERHAIKEGGGLLDLYCGAGVLSSIWTSRLPGLFSGVRGFDITESAIVSASSNLKHFQGPVDFRAIDLASPGSLEIGNDFVIADPARGGLSPALRKILIANPVSTFLYISCNPEGQARDLKELSAAYRISEARIFDCYPQTPHLEQAVFLVARA